MAAAMLEPVRAVLGLLEARERRRWLWLLVLGVAGGALEAAGAAAIFALIGLLGNPESTIGFGARLLPGALGTGRDPMSAVASFAAIVALLFVVKNSLRVLEMYLRARSAAESGVAIARRLLATYLAAPYDFHLTRNSARLIRDVESAAEGLSQNVLLAATSIVSSSLTVIAVTGVLVVAAPSTALAAALVVGALLVVLLRRTAYYFGTWGRQANHLRAGVLKSLQQSLGLVKEVKLLGRGAFFADDYARSRRALSKLLVWRGLMAEAPPVLVETLFVCGVASLVLLARWQRFGELLPLLGLFSYAGLRILPPLSQIVTHLNGMRFSRGVVEEILHEREAARAGAANAATAPVERLPLRDRLLVSRVSYRYPGSEHVALRDVSFEVRRGEAIGIVGPSGAGKSTLVDLILGMLAPLAGRVTVDGVGIHDRVEAWQRQIGYVPQTHYILDDTLRRNVALGLDPAEIDDDRVQAVLRIAQLDRLLARLPEGLDTVVGEHGATMSGGERQRLCVARALYHDPEVLIFDEATASLDDRTERELADEIERLRGEKTLIVVAHRPQAMRRCDRLVLLEAGSVVAVDSYDQLAPWLEGRAPRLATSARSAPPGRKFS